MAERVLGAYSEVGLIDDQAFAAAWVSSRHRGRGLARRALAQELRHRGVEEETVKEAVERLVAWSIRARSIPELLRGLEQCCTASRR